MADVALVSLGGTVGLGAADSELADSLRRAGASVDVVTVEPPREVRTFTLTDLGWARAARRSAAGDEVASAACVVYSSVTSALLWRRRGAIRFDSLAAANRPGRHGVWQRPLERRRVREASLLVPWSDEALAGAPAQRAESVVVPVPVEPSGPADGPRDIAAITYGANWEKKGLDRVLSAWARAAREGEELVVCGIESADARHAGPETTANVRFTGTLPRDEYRSLVRRSRLFVTAPRREDHGIAQLEALADGCALVTADAPGPYVALGIARVLDARLVVAGSKTGFEEGELIGGLGRAVRIALDDPRPDYAERAAAALAPLSRAAVDATVANELLPRLLAR